MTQPLVLGSALTLAGYGLWKLVRAARTGTAPAGARLVERYRPGTEEPGPLVGDWTTYAGARHELRGAPTNTILLVRGLDRHPPEFRARLLDLAEQVKIPVDSLATIMSAESNGMDAAALNPLPAAGLIQLTVGANLPGFRVAPGELSLEQARAKIREITTWSAEEQLERVVKPYMGRMKLREPPTPGKLYMLNFLPDEASKPDETIIGIEGEQKRGPDGAPVLDKEGKPVLTWPGKVFALNAGFWQGKHDGQGRRVITVGDVKDKARAVARGAKGRRMTVDGQVLEARASKAVAAAVAANVPEAPTRTATPAPKASSPGLTPVQAVVGASTDEVHDLNELAGGLLVRALRNGSVIMPPWRSVRVGDLEIDVMTDALQATVRLVDTGPEAVKGLRRGVAPPKDLGPTRLRLPVSWLETVEIARALGAVPFTREWWDATWKAADQKITPQALPATDEMGSLRWTLRHTQNVDAQARGGVLLRDVGKGWIIPSPADAAANERIRTARAVNYGWLQPATGKPIQTPGTRHDEHHYDYSQVCVLVRRQVRRGGATFDALQVLASLGYDGRWLNALA